MQGSKLMGFLRRIPPATYIILLMIAIYGIAAPGFFTLGNLENVGNQAAPLLIVAIGVTMVIMTEGTDLSIGYVMGMVGVVVSIMLRAKIWIGWAFLAGIAVGVLCGFINGVAVAKLKLPPFIATLGTGNVIFGIGLVITEGYSIQALDPALLFLASGKVLGISMPILIATVVFAFCWILMNYTAFGRNIVSLGGNSEALRGVGLNVGKASISVYMMCGFLAAIGGLIVASRTGSGYSAAAMGWEFDAIGASIIGGTSFEEGNGSIGRTVIGVALISILRNGLNVVGVPNMYQYALIGAIVLTAIILDVRFRQAAKGGVRRA